MVGAIRQGFIKGIWIFMLPSGPRKVCRVRGKVRKGLGEGPRGLQESPRGLQSRLDSKLSLAGIAGRY